MSRSIFLVLFMWLVVALPSRADTLPAAPGIGTATAGSGSATVSFIPGSLGSGTLVNYTVVCNNNTQTGNGSPITVMGLTNGAVYGCRARVTTTVGTSPWSGLTNAVTPGGTLPAVSTIGAATPGSATMPAAPAIGSATPGSGSATVSFMPGSLGSGTLVNYTIVCNNTTKNGTGSPITVTGLTNGAVYGCRARATTTVGTSPWSGLTNAVTPGSTLPTAPAIGSATPGDGSATVSFTPGPFGSGTLVNFTVVCNNTIQTGTGSPITVTGLTNGAAYGCRVRATTTVGTSPWSEPSNAVTPGTGQVAGGGRQIIWSVAVLLLAAAAWLVARRHSKARTANPEFQILTIHHTSNALMLFILGLLWVPGAVALVIYFTGQKIADPSAPLVGVVEKKMSMSKGFQSILDGQFQKEFATSVAGRLPFYASISRLFNEAQYALLDTSSNREILVGRDGYLLHTVYTSAYCKRDIASSAPAMASWAKMISEIQAGFQSRGQKFLFVLTPSKIEHIPEKLPVGYPCRSADRDLFISEALKYLDLAGVNYVDAGSRIDEVQKRYGYEPFPKGGIHWTELAALGATNDIIEKLNKVSGKQVAIPYEVKAVDALEASNEDMDFARLMNLKWLPSPNRTAKIVRERPASGSCPPPTSIVNVGGSFFTAIARNLVSSPCPPSVRQLSYFVVDQRHFYDKGNGPEFGVEKLDFSLLKTAEVVILEEFAGIMMKTSHTPNLHKYITTGVLPVAQLGNRP